jgi:hypothetical protein
MSIYVSDTDTDKDKDTHTHIHTPHLVLARLLSPLLLARLLIIALLPTDCCVTATHLKSCELVEEVLYLTHQLLMPRLLCHQSFMSHRH